MAKRYVDDPVLVALASTVLAWRRVRDFSREALAAKVGTDAKNLYRFERGQENPSVRRLMAYANALDVDLGRLFAPSAEDRRWINSLRGLSWSASAGPCPMSAVAIPVLDLRPQAGRPDLGHPDPRASGWAVPPEGRHPRGEGLFLAQVLGDSMAPRVPDGAWCLFSQPVSEIQPGADLLVCETDPSGLGGWSLKRLEIVEPAREGSERVRLVSDNPAHPPREVVLSDEGPVRVVAEMIDILGQG